MIPAKDPNTAFNNHMRNTSLGMRSQKSNSVMEHYDSDYNIQHKDVFLPDSRMLGRNNQIISSKMSRKNLGKTSQANFPKCSKPKFRASFQNKTEKSTVYPFDFRQLLSSQNGQNSFMPKSNISETAMNVSQDVVPNMTTEMNCGDSLAKQRAQAQFRGKVDGMDVVLRDQMQRIRADYLEKTGECDSRYAIQEAIDKKMRAIKIKPINSRVAKSTDSELFTSPKVDGFTDHNGFYISGTGHKIDDYSLAAQLEAEKDIKTRLVPESDYISPQHRELKVPKKTLHEKEIISGSARRRRSKEFSVTIRSKSSLVSELEGSPPGRPAFTKSDKKRRSPPQICVGSSLSPHNQSSQRSPEAIQTTKNQQSAPTQLPQLLRGKTLEQRCRRALAKQRNIKIDHDTEKAVAEQVKAQLAGQTKMMEKLYGGLAQRANRTLVKGHAAQNDKIQLKNLSKVVELSEQQGDLIRHPPQKKSQRDKEKYYEQYKSGQVMTPKGKPGLQSAQIAYMDACYNQGQQLPPFLFKNCLVRDPLLKHGQCVLRLSKSKISDSAAHGIADGLLNYDAQVECIEIGNVGLTDSSITTILQSCLEKGTVHYNIKQASIGPYSCAKLREICTTRSDKEARRTIFVTGLVIDDCKVAKREIKQILDDCVDEYVEGAEDLRVARASTPVVGRRLARPVKPPEVTILPLEILHLQSLRLTHAPTAIAYHSPFLKSLNLSSNYYKPDPLDSLLPALLHSPTIKYLNLSHNPFSRYGVNVLSQLFQHSFSLLEVDLSYVQLKDPKSDVGALFKGMTQSQTMQSLHLQGIGNTISTNALRQVELTYLNISSSSKSGHNYWSDLKNFSVNSTENLVYSRLLVGNYIGFKRSARWRRQNRCWICDRHNLCMIVFNVRGANLDAQRPVIVIGQGKNALPAKKMKAINKIVPHLRFEAKQQNSEIHRKHDPKIIKSSLEDQAKQLGFSPQVHILPVQLQTGTGDGPCVSRVYVTSIMLKPGQKLPIFVNNSHLSDIAPLPRPYEIQTFISSLDDLQSVGRDLKPLEPYEDVVQASMTNNIAITLSTIQSEEAVQERHLTPKEENDLKAVAQDAHFYVLKEQFAHVARGHSAQNFNYIPTTNAHAVKTLQQFDQCFSYDFDETDFPRLIPKNTSFVQRCYTSQKLFCLLKLAYPTICELFYSVLASATTPAQMSYYPMIRTEDFYRLVDKMQLHPAGMEDKEVRHLVREVCRESLRYLKENEQVECKDDKTKTETQLHYANLSVHKDDGIRRSQMLEVVVRMAQKYFPGEDIVTAVGLFMSRILPQVQKLGKVTGEADKWNLRGRDEYRVLYLLVQQVDDVLNSHKVTVEKLLKRLRIQRSTYVSYKDIVRVFAHLFPQYGVEIHACFVLSKRLVCEERESRESHFILDRSEFYEFLTRLSRIVICGTSTANSVQFLGLPPKIGKYFPAQELHEELTILANSRNEATNKKKLVNGKMVFVGDDEDTGFDLPPDSSEEAEPEVEVEGYLPYFVTLDILFLQIEHKLQYV